MASPISEEPSDFPSPKKLQKIEANTTCEDYDSDEELRQFNDEWNKSDGFEIDFSKLTNWFNCQPVDLEDSTWRGDKCETDREFIAFLANAALNDRNAKWGTSLELGKILRAMFHPGTGITFYISFEVNDPAESDGNQTKPFRAEVGYLGRHNSITVYSCDPKPSP